MKKTTKLELFKKLAKQIDYDSILEKEMQLAKIAKERLQDGSTPIRVNLDDL